MGIDFDGGMIVGRMADQIAEPGDYEDSFADWLDDNDMDTMSLYYDADEDKQYAGFRVNNVPVAEMCGEWLADVKAKAATFEELTGEPAHLIGTQNIW